jgi:GAF domain-containing protein
VTFAQRLETTLSVRDREAEAELAAGESLETILERYLRAIEAAAASDMRTSILLLDADGRRLLHGAAPSLPKVFCDAIHGTEIGPFAGTCGTAAYLKRPVYVSDIADDPLWDDYRHLALPHGLRACWSTPIETEEGRLLGTFAIYYLTPRGPTTEELAAVSLITRHVAEAIDAGARANAAASGAKSEGSLWRRMQQIERCRHHAELAERRGASGSRAFRREMSDVAQQWRQLTLEYEALFRTEH